MTDTKAAKLKMFLEKKEKKLNIEISYFLWVSNLKIDNWNNFKIKYKHKCTCQPSLKTYTPL